jgi:ABC-type Fe3+-citrate transport system substrate-binding protein
VGDLMNSENIYDERFKRQDEKIADIKENVDKVNEKVDIAIEKLTTQIEEVNDKTHILENTLSNRLTQIESKFDVYNNLTHNILTDLQKKMDNLIVRKNDESQKKTDKNNQDMFKDWIVKKGFQIVDFALYGGVLYAVAKGLKLF